MENGVTMAQSVSFMTQYSRRYICSIIDSVVYDLKTQLSGVDEDTIIALLWKIILGIFTSAFKQSNDFFNTTFPNILTLFWILTLFHFMNKIISQNYQGQNY